MSEVSAFNYLTCPLRGANLIDASAGTGKTFSMERLVARFVVESGFKIDSVLVVTFTKSATAELSVRIQKLLMRLMKLFHEAEGRADMEQLLNEPSYAAYRDISELALVLNRSVSRDELMKRLKRAIRDFDDASVYTIHGFCEKMLRDCAFTCGTTRNYSYGEDARLLEVAIDVELRRAFKEFRPAPGEEDAIRRRVYDALLEMDTFSEIARGIVGEEDAVIANMQYLPARQTKGKRSKTEAVSESEALFRREFSRTVGKIFIRIKQELRRQKEQVKRLSYDDILLRFKEYLQQYPELAGYCRSKFRAVLIDEFQDTDPTQYAIFKTLFLAGTESGCLEPVAPVECVYFVGDPKQAIYSFRNAELQTYFDAERDVGRGRVQTLTKNFRSNPAIVTAVNTFFGRDKGARTFLTEAIAYSPSDFDAQKLPLAWYDEARNIIIEPVPAFELWTNANAIEANQSDEELIAADIVRLLSPRTDNPSARVHLVELRKNAGAEVVDVVDAGRLEARHIAILTSRRYDALAVKAALARRGIRTRQKSKESVFASDEANELLMLLSAMENPNQTNLLKSAAASRLVGYTVREIKDCAGDDLVLKMRTQLRKAAENFVRLGAYTVFSELMMEFSTFARLLNVRNGERILMNYRHLIELMQSSLPRGSGIVAAIGWLSKKITAADDEIADEEALRIESEENVVSIITIHDSKGLEYPVVYLVRADKLQVPVSANSGKMALFKEVTDAGRQLKFAKTPVKMWSTHTQSYMRSEEEQVRLAYVAMTRASKRLVLPLVFRGEGSIHPKAIFCAYLRSLEGLYGAEHLDEGTPTEPEKSSPRLSSTAVDLALRQWFERLRSALYGWSSTLDKTLPQAYLKLCGAGRDESPLVKMMYYNELAGKADGAQRYSAHLSEVKARYVAPTPEEIARASCQWQCPSFSSVSRAFCGETVTAKPRVTQASDTGAELRSFPAGTNPGDALHKLIEAVIDRSLEKRNVLTAQEIESIVAQNLKRASLFSEASFTYDSAVMQRLGLEGTETSEANYCERWVSALLQTLLSRKTNLLTEKTRGRLNLADAIEAHTVTSELDFLMKATENRTLTPRLLADVLSETLSLIPNDEEGNRLDQKIAGYVTGQIDLLVKARDPAGDKFWILDWKSNSLRNNAEHSADWAGQYDTESMKAAIEQHAYRLQALFYLTALYRYLRGFYGDDAMRHIGGAVYIFLRGISEQSPETGRFVMTAEEMAPAILRLDAILSAKKEH